MTTWNVKDVALCKKTKRKILMSEIIFDSNTTKKTLQDNSKTDGFLESKGISVN